MTDEEYISKSNGVAQRLEIMRKQVDGHLANAHHSVSNDTLVPLFEAMDKACDELKKLNEQFWAKRKGA